MICRIWRGWTAPDNAAVHQAVVRGQVIPAIEARAVPGFRHIDLMRRDADHETEFTTIMWFDDLASVRAFADEDYETAHVPLAARKTLARWDERVPHFIVLDRRSQNPGLIQRSSPDPYPG